MSELSKGFQKLGARVREKVDRHVRLRLDVMRDHDGEYFMVRHGEDVRVDVLEVTPSNRHLLLSVNGALDGAGARSTFLCGRDEFHWFVAAIPESAQADTVLAAMDALKPREVWESIREHKLPEWERNSRRNAAFLRQGEWFFLPRPWLEVNAKEVLENEPIRRGAGKPHICRHLYRTGGEAVYVSSEHPNGLSYHQYRHLPRKERKRQRWTHMTRDARVFVKGTVQHADHKVLWLPYWHQVVMNTETQSSAMRNVAFLD
jgi:hypothetical protein